MGGVPPYPFNPGEGAQQRASDAQLGAHASEALAPSLPAKPATLQLVLRESEDEDADQRRLAAVFRLLQSQPGEDAVRLTIHTRAGETIDLALPSAKLDDALREKLGEALGESAPAPR